tara:strand:+ start:6137 stop:6562 length:426 start_codon:yes stop_codon:yes gene_type:complete
MEEPPDKPSASFLPYPTSTLSPRILPNDLTTFKSRGISRVQKEFQQQLKELHEQYRELVDQFNWNKLIYEAKFGFEPLVGESYHLYEIRGQRVLSMIAPEQWKGKKWIASFRLNSDGQWKMENCVDDFSLQDLIESEDPAT